jgi:hypothetical protein
LWDSDVLSPSIDFTGLILAGRGRSILIRSFGL